jgi:hypothetical protein
VPGKVPRIRCSRAARCCIFRACAYGLMTLLLLSGISNLSRLLFVLILCYAVAIQVTPSDSMRTT